MTAMKSVIFILLCLGWTGCESYRLNHLTAPLDASLATPARETLATVARVEARDKYVVVHFGAATIPRIGTQLLVFRDGKPVGRVELTEPTYPPYATANILEGELKVGDTLRREQPKANPQADGQKVGPSPENSGLPTPERKKNAPDPALQTTDRSTSKSKKTTPKAHDQPENTPQKTQ
jgi:hypothetical protein